MGKIFDREPVLVMGLIQTSIAVGTSFGLDLTGEQITAILAFTGSVLSVIVRRKVEVPKRA